jgi:hypothetical protein
MHPFSDIPSNDTNTSSPQFYSQYGKAEGVIRQAKQFSECQSVSTTDVLLMLCPHPIIAAQIIKHF